MLQKYGSDELTATMVVASGSARDLHSEEDEDVVEGVGLCDNSSQSELDIEEETASKEGLSQFALSIPIPFPFLPPQQTIAHSYPAPAHPHPAPAPPPSAPTPPQSNLCHACHSRHSGARPAHPQQAGARPAHPQQADARPAPLQPAPARR